MKKSNYLNILVVPLQSGLRRETKQLVHGKTIQLEFSSKAELHRMSKRERRKYEVCCVLNKISDEMGIVLWSIPQQRDIQFKNK